MIEKIVKETFKPDEKIEKKSDKVIEEEPGGGVFIPEERGARVYPDVLKKSKKYKKST